MSSDDVERVRTLERKALELYTKGHALRAAEYYGRAAEAARCFGDDNLVLVAVQLKHSQVLHAYVKAAAAAAGATPECLASHRAESVALTVAALDALERRRAAGTLQPAACTAAEVAWRAAAVRRDTVDMTAAEAERYCRLVGYWTVVYAAGNALGLLEWSRAYAAECTRAQLEAFTRVVAHASALMAHKSHAIACVMDVEDRFFSVFLSAVAAARADALDARLAAQLEHTWKGLQRSGVLQARHIAKGSHTQIKKANAGAAALRKSLTAPGLRSCGLAGCGAREAHPQHFKSCGACRVPAYCCKEHQAADWPSHKAACKAARKAASDDDDGAGPSGA